MTTTAPTADPLDAALAAAFGPSAGLPAAFGVGLGVAVPLAGPDGEPRYELFGEIARGGMGVLRHGRDTQLGRDVAVKVLRDDLAADPEMRRRFEGEARVAGRLQHPGIAPVYDLGRLDDRRPYFSMKLITGRTLAEVLADTVWPDGKRTVTPVSAHCDPMFAVPTPELNRLIDVLVQVSQAVAYAHSKGIAHRDLKPANVMVGEFGEVLVLDWGLAREAATSDEAPAAAADSTDPAATRPGTVMGTPAYMAPEQARGEAGRDDKRCDVFALGAILCEVITGKPPYAGATAAEVRRRAETWGAADADRAVGCAAGWALYELTRQCLAPNPAARPADAGVVAARLVAYRTAARETAEFNRRHEAGVVAAEGEARSWRGWSAALWSVIVGLAVAAGGLAWQSYGYWDRLRVAEARLAEQLERDRMLSANARSRVSLEIAESAARRGLDALRAGNAAEAGKEFAAAETALRDALGDDPELGLHRAFHLNLAIVLLYNRKPDEAAVAFDAAARRCREPKDWEEGIAVLRTHATAARSAGRAEFAAAADRELDRLHRDRK